LAQGLWLEARFRSAVFVASSAMTVLKRPCSADTSVPDAKIRKIVGCDQGGHMYECSRYVWWDKRAHCFTEQDRKFSSKRMALLYLAKMNSASLEDFLKETGKQWMTSVRIPACTL